MTPQQWTTIRHFTPKENWGDPAKMHYELLQALDRLRNFVGRRVIVHCGFEVRAKGWHPKGRAVDLHIEGLHPMEQFIAASRFKEFNGLGVYLWWHSPGLHLDNRPLPFYKPRALWGSTSEGVYVPFDTDFFALAAALPWPPAEEIETA
jgi:uncharacterized protein YcbK (DUF882 family)